MLIESKHNRKPWICNEAVKIRHRNKNNYSYIIQSLLDVKIYFIYRNFSFGCVKVKVYKKSFSSNMPLTIEEETFFNKIINNKWK